MSGRLVGNATRRSNRARVRSERAAASDDGAKSQQVRSKPASATAVTPKSAKKTPSQSSQSKKDTPAPSSKKKTPSSKCKKKTSRSPGSTDGRSGSTGPGSRVTASVDDYLHLCKMVKLVGEKEPIFGPKEWEEVTTAMCEYFSEGMSSKASLFGAAHAKRWWKALTTAKGPSGQPAKARHFILAQKIEEDMQRRQHSGICIESPDGSEGEGDVDDNEDDKEEDRYNPKTSGFHYNPKDGMYHLGPYKEEEEQEQEEQEQEEGDGRPEGDAGRAYYYVVFSQASPHGRVVCVEAAWGPEHTAKPRPMPSTERQREQRIRKKCKVSAIAQP